LTSFVEHRSHRKKKEAPVRETSFYRLLLAKLSGVLRFFRFSFLVLFSYFLCVRFACEFRTERTLAGSRLRVLLSYFLRIRFAGKFRTKISFGSLFEVVVVCHRYHLHGY